MMGPGDFTDEFKRDAVTQIAERNCPAKEIPKRLGVSTYALHVWKRRFAKAISDEGEKDVEVRRLTRELALVPKERDIVKEATVDFARDAE